MTLDDSRLGNVSELLAEEGFIQSLARKLVHDEHLAHDVAQETFVAALKRPRKRAAPLRSWLVRVIKNRAIQSHRRRSRRENHEALAPRPEPSESSPADLAERDGLRRHVCAAVHSMHEPYRTAILMRFFDELEPAEIAARLQVPVETVRTRLKRGLAQLRERLDREYGDRSRWALVLLAGDGRPLAGAPPASTSTPWLAIAATIGVIAIALLWIREIAAPRNSGSIASVVPEARGSTASSSTDAAAVLAPPTESLRTATRVAWALSVVDDAGVPVEGVPIEAPSPAGGLRSVLSDKDGAAAIEWHWDRDLALDVAPTRSTLGRKLELKAGERAEDGSATTIVVQRASLVRGRTLDEAANSLGQVDVIARALDASGNVDAEGAELAVARSNAQGEFEIGGLPKGFALEARGLGRLSREWLTARLPEPGALEGIELALVAPMEVAGMVVDADGVPLADARIAIKRARGDVDVRPTPSEHAWYRARPVIARTSALDGSFAFADVAPGRYVVNASRAGYVGFQRNVFASTDSLRMELAAARPLAIAVFDEHGSPVAQADLLVCLAGDDASGQGARSRKITSDASGLATLVETHDGARCLIRAGGPDLATTVIGPVELDERTPVRLTIPSGRRLVGRAVDNAGTPIVGAQVLARSLIERATLEAFRLGWRNEITLLGSATTDASGDFVFEHAAPVEIELELRLPGASAAAHSIRVAANEDVVELRLAHATGAHAAVEGIVRDARDGSPLESFTVAALANKLERNSATLFARVDRGDGTFRIAVPEPGRWFLAVVAGGFAIHTEAVEIAADDRTRVDISLYPTRSIGVSIVDSAGRPVRSATIVATDAFARELLLPIDETQMRNVVHVGARGDAILRSVPATLIHLHVTTPWSRREHRFELDLATETRDQVQLALDFAAASPPVGWLDLRLRPTGEVDAQGELSDAPTDADPTPLTALTGRLELRQFDSGGRMLVELAGELEAGALVLDPQRQALYATLGPSGTFEGAWRQQVRTNWSAAHGRELYPTFEPLRAVPIAPQATEIEIRLAGGEPLRMPLAAWIEQANATANRIATVQLALRQRTR